ncbi:MAG: hypothetical protein ACT6FG_08615 [Methanosarcinaceae archaeon]
MIFDQCSRSNVVTANPASAERQGTMIKIIDPDDVKYNHIQGRDNC